MKSVAKYKINWGHGQVEEFSRLKYALDARDYYMDCMCEDYAPNIIAVLNDGTEILLV